MFYSEIIFWEYFYFKHPQCSLQYSKRYMPCEIGHLNCVDWQKNAFLLNSLLLDVFNWFIAPKNHLSEFQFSYHVDICVTSYFFQGKIYDCICILLRPRPKLNLVEVTLIVIIWEILSYSRHIQQTNGNELHSCF